MVAPPAPLGMVGGYSFQMNFSMPRVSKLAPFGFYASLFMSRLADQVLLFLVPLVVFQTTQSAAWSGIAFFVETLPRFMAYPVCGALCDRLPTLRFGDYGKTTGGVIMLNNLSQPAAGLAVGLFAAKSDPSAVMAALTGVMGLLGRRCGPRDVERGLGRRVEVERSFLLQPSS